MIFSIRLLILVLASASIPASAQQSSPSTIGLRGMISAKAMISPSGHGLTTNNVEGVTARLMREGDERIKIHLAGIPQSNNTAINVLLLLRANAAFELQSFLLTSADAPAISASVASFRATGPAVVAGAIESIRTEASQIDLSAAPSVIATGSRISRGPASLSTNAVEIELLFEAIPNGAGHWSADIMVLISVR
jgi:hypothetical protein